MKITLIYSGIGILGFGQIDKTTSGEAHWISHGLASIGASLKYSGFDVNLIDMRTLNNWNDFETVIRNRSPDVVGISVSYLDYKSVCEIIQILRDKFASVRIVIGGQIPTMFPEKLYKEADYLIRGEGEIAMVELCQALRKNEEFPKISYGKIPDLNSLPYVDRELFDYRRELQTSFIWDGQTPEVTMISGRGCPYSCTFCQPVERTIFQSCRRRSVSSVIDELNILWKKYQFKRINWWDDTFTLQPDWIYEFCSEYKKYQFGVKMSCCARADTICNNELMITQLAGIGFDVFVIGFESGSQRILDFLKKGTTVQQNLDAAKICRKYGIKILGTWMLGLPTETKQDQLVTMKMIYQINPDYPLPFYFTPIPGTEIFSFCEHNGFLTNRDNFDIERTAIYKPKIKGINYEYLDNLLLEFGKRKM